MPGDGIKASNAIAELQCPDCRLIWFAKLKSWAFCPSCGAEGGRRDPFMSEGAARVTAQKEGRL